MNNSTFLDIDDSILLQKFVLPECAQGTELEEAMKQISSVPSVTVQPAPGVCVKVKTESGEKVFINICISDQIPEPEDNINVIPLSIGSEKLEADKSGALCPTYDVMLNSKFFNKCQENTLLWQLTTETILNGINAKFNKNLQMQQVTTLKNRKVLGKLQPHRIEKRAPKTLSQIKKPLIEVISESPSINKKGDSKCKNPNKKLSDEPKVKTDSGVLLLRHPARGTPNLIIGLFNVPKVINSNDITVLIHEDRIIIEAVDYNLMYDTLLPYYIKTETVTSFLDKNLGVLRVNMQIEDLTTNKLIQ